MSILLTGGTGFIGSHTAVELIKKNYDVVIIDNLSNSENTIINRIEMITGVRPAFYKIDAADKNALRKVFSDNDIDAVIHFAGHKIVNESIHIPVEYYRNNLDSTLTVLEVMKEYNCKKFIFSSSAAVYGVSDNIPYSEDEKELGASNPYGRTKLMIEHILKDASYADKEMSVVLLRYFNPIGAHESGIIGEKPNGIPSNIMPYITQVAAGIRDHLSIFGNDYPTHDGTGVRDYIHVVDLAKGHVAAYDYCQNKTGCEIFNLGTGSGYSVLDLVKAFEEANGIKIPYEITPRRDGDLAESYASTEKAEKFLHWKTEKSIIEMCRDSWRWQQSKWCK